LGGTRKYIGLVIPIALVTWRVWSLGPTSFETLAHQPAGAAATDFKVSVVATMWIGAIALMLVVRALERQPLDSIGFRRPSWRDLAGVPIVVIASALLETLWTLVLLTAGGHTTSIVPVSASALPLGVRVLMFGTEPFFEETVFRGYAIERFESLTSSTTGAVCGSALASSLMHGGWTLGLAIIPLGLGSAALYAWRRNLWACVLFHSLWMLPILLGVA